MKGRGGTAGREAIALATRGAVAKKGHVGIAWRFRRAHCFPRFGGSHCYARHARRACGAV